MKEITKAYYEENPDMVKKLIETKNIPLIHYGPRIDPFWGQPKKGGENHHGKILMDIREYYQNKLKEEEEGTSEEET